MLSVLILLVCLRAGISEDVRRDLKQAFRIIYRSGFSLSKAIEEMEMQLDSSVEIENLLRFLRNADRGIMRTRRAKFKEPRIMYEVFLWAKISDKMMKKGHKPWCFNGKSGYL